tara:strand:+ start:1133 stop:1654 length:522 start_codon:yes stop_codon:yes gene_type:complete
MRKRILLNAGVFMVVATIAQAQAAEEAEPFVDTLLRDVAFGSSCRDEYDPSTAIHQHSMREGRMRKWEEPDRREPDTTNHMVEWVFPGFVLTTSTHFGWFGPSTWLHSLKLSSPTKLPRPLAFGQTPAEVSESLGNAVDKSRARQFWYESAYVTLSFGEDGKLEEVILECIAD